MVGTSLVLSYGLKSGAVSHPCEDGLMKLRCKNDCGRERDGVPERREMCEERGGNKSEERQEGRQEKVGGGVVVEKIEVECRGMGRGVGGICSKVINGFA